MLIATEMKPFVAELDIVCHKFMKRVSDTEFKSPYKKMKWILNKLEVTTLVDKKILLYGAHTVVYNGYHAYLYPENPRITAASDPNKYVAVTCIIPKGSLCYTSTSSTRFNAQIVSNQMMITSIDSL